MKKRTSLYESQKSLGATFGTCDVSSPGGQKTLWEVASYFSSFENEYGAVRRSVGVVDLSHRGKIVITGPDRVRFLNGQVTNDVKKLVVGQGCYACALDYKGSLVGDMKIFALDNALLIDTSEVCTQRLFEHLQRFAISDEVEIIDQTEQLVHLGLHGPRSATLLARLGGSDWSSLGEYRHCEIELAGTRTRVIRQDYTGEMGFDLIVPAKEAATLWNLLLVDEPSQGLECFGTKTLNVLRLEAGIPVFGVDMTEEHLALEANLISSISTTKGCYAGQEVVARIINRGHVNRLLVGLRLEGPEVPPCGQKIFKGDKVTGEITSAAFSPFLGRAIALGYVPWSESDPGNVYRIGEVDSAREAEVVSLPFYVRH
jgi:folate-binding protein YgfZ